MSKHHLKQFTSKKIFILLAFLVLVFLALFQGIKIRLTNLQSSDNKNATVIPSGIKNNVNLQNGSYITRNHQSFQTGPHDYACFPAEVTKQQESNLIAFKCAPNNPDMNCTLTDGRTLSSITITKQITVHYTCDPNQVNNWDGLQCYSDNPKHSTTSVQGKDKTSIDEIVTDSSYNIRLTEHNSTAKTISLETNDCLPAIMTKNSIAYLKCPASGNFPALFKLDFNNLSATKSDLIYTTDLQSCT